MHFIVLGDLKKRILSYLLTEVLERTVPGRVGRDLG